MGTLQSPTPQQLLTEAIIFWSIGLFLFVLRILSRSIQHGGIKKLLLDDYILCLTFCCYTSLMVLINVSANYATNLYEPSQEAQILADPQDVRNRIYGSKIVVGLEQCMMYSTWGVKTVLLTMWFKLTQNVKHNIFVKIVAAYTLLGFIVIEVTYFALWCRPFAEYWAVPASNPQCATYQHYSITQAVFNISSDLMILAIPIPVILGLKLPLTRRLILLSMFSLGLFVVLAAILNKYYNFSNPQTTIYMIWYIRESSTAIYVTCLLALWPLLRRVFKLRNFESVDSAPLSPAAGKFLDSDNLSPASSSFPQSPGLQHLASSEPLSPAKKKTWRHRLAGNPADISISAALNTTASMEEMIEKSSPRASDDVKAANAAVLSAPRNPASPWSIPELDFEDTAPRRP